MRANAEALRQILMRVAWVSLAALAACQPSASQHRLGPSDEDKVLAHKFRGISGGELYVDAIKEKQCVNIFNEHGDYFYASSTLSLRNNSKHSYSSRFGVPKFIRVQWHEYCVATEASASVPHGMFTGGPVIGDYTVPVAARFPDELLDKVRAGKGELRLKIRLHDDGPLIGWDLQTGFGQTYYAGGDFREARWVYEDNVREPRKHREKGWYIHPKTRQKIETDF
jgi:hypothetical protein